MGHLEMLELLILCVCVLHLWIFSQPTSASPHHNQDYFPSKQSPASPFLDSSSTFGLMTFASAVSIKMSTSAENRLWNIYFPGLPRHDEMISFPWRRVLIGREADDLYQRLMTNMGQWLCVGSGDEWGEPGKMGPRAQRLAYISFHPPWLFHPNFFFFFTTQWPVFSCVPWIM